MMQCCAEIRGGFRGEIVDWSAFNSDRPSIMYKYSATISYVIGINIVIMLYKYSATISYVIGININTV